MAIDDAEEYLMLLEGILGDAGFRVQVFSDPLKALAALPGDPPELILLDMYMPELDGTEICRRLKADPATRGIPVLFLSGASEAAERVAGLHLGAVDFITKPFHHEELLARVRTHLEIRRLRNRVEEQVAQLRQGNELLNATQRIAHAGGWAFDAATGAVSGTDQLAALLGLGADAVLGRDGLVALVHADDRAAFAAAFAAALAGTADDRELRLAGDAAEPRWMRSILMPQMEDGRVVRVLGSLMDITERKHEEARRAMGARLESIGQLAAGIAHEINTPIQFIGDNLRFLEDATRDLLAPAPGADLDLPYLVREVPRAISQSLEGVERVSSIVKAMKEFAHPDAGERLPADLNHLVATSVAVAAGASRGIAEVVVVPDPALPPVPCLAGGLKQVVLNLVVNAAQAIAAQRRDVPGRITLTTHRDGAWAELIVADDGPGIPAAILDRIFDPFFTTKPVGEGSGQGLSLARAVVEKQHGGTISCASRPGEGAVFTVRLPLA